MDPTTFDRMARTLGAAGSRRDVLKRMLGGALGGALAATGRMASAKQRSSPPPPEPHDVCTTSNSDACQTTPVCGTHEDGTACSCALNAEGYPVCRVTLSDCDAPAFCEYDGDCGPGKICVQVPDGCGEPKCVPPSHKKGICSTRCKPKVACAWYEVPCGSACCDKDTEYCEENQYCRAKNRCAEYETPCGNDCCDNHAEYCKDGQYCRAKNRCARYETPCGSACCDNDTEYCTDGRSCKPKNRCAWYETPCGRACCDKDTEYCRAGYCRPKNQCAAFQIPCGSACCDEATEYCKNGRSCKPKNRCGAGKTTCSAPDFTTRCCRWDRVCVKDWTNRTFYCARTGRRPRRRRRARMGRK